MISNSCRECCFCCELEPCHLLTKQQTKQTHTGISSNTCLDCACKVNPTHPLATQRAWQGLALGQSRMRQIVSASGQAKASSPHVHARLPCCFTPHSRTQPEQHLSVAAHQQDDAPCNNPQTLCVQERLSCRYVVGRCCQRCNGAKTKTKTKTGQSVKMQLSSHSLPILHAAETQDTHWQPWQQAQGSLSGSSSISILSPQCSQVPRVLVSTTLTTQLHGLRQVLGHSTALWSCWSKP